MHRCIVYFSTRICSLSPYLPIPYRFGSSALALRPPPARASTLALCTRRTGPAGAGAVGHGGLGPETAVAAAAPGRGGGCCKQTNEKRWWIGSSSHRVKKLVPTKVSCFKLNK